MSSSSPAPMVLLQTVNKMLQKQGDFQEALHTHHGLCKATAIRLHETQPGSLETLLKQLHQQQPHPREEKTNHHHDDDDNAESAEEKKKDEKDLHHHHRGGGGEVDPGSSLLPSHSQIQAFCQEQRQRLKQLAQHNVHQARQVEVFMATLRQFQQQIQAPSSSSSSSWAEQFQTCFQAQQQEKESSYLPLEQEAWVREIYQELGEKLPTVAVPPAARGKRGRRSVEDEEDEIEFMVSQSATSQSQGLQQFKCPITTTWMEDPVRNTVCKHAYSKIGITTYLKAQQQSHAARYGGGIKCPVAGCPNHALSASQLQSDKALAVQIRRLFKRGRPGEAGLDPEADHIVDDDEEEDEQEF